jgi:hypothetical protein
VPTAARFTVAWPAQNHCHIGVVTLAVAPRVCCREQELLEEMEERIEAFQARIEFNDQQIVAMATPALGVQPSGADAAEELFGRESKDGGDDDSKLEGEDDAYLSPEADGSVIVASLHLHLHVLIPPVTCTAWYVPHSSAAIRNVSTLPMARTLLKMLFRMMVDLKRDERNKVRVPLCRVASVPVFGIVGATARVRHVCIVTCG